MARHLNLGNLERGGELFTLLGWSKIRSNNRQQKSDRALFTLLGWSKIRSKNRQQKSDRALFTLLGWSIIRSTNRWSKIRSTNRQTILIEHCSHFWDGRKMVENPVKQSSKNLIEHCSHFWDSRKLVENPVGKSSNNSGRTLFTLLGRSNNGRKSGSEIFKKM